MLTVKGVPEPPSKLTRATTVLLFRNAALQWRFQVAADAHFPHGVEPALLDGTAVIHDRWDGVIATEVASGKTVAKWWPREGCP